MAAHTVLDTGDSWQQASYLNEIIDSYNETRAIVGLAAVDQIAEGDSIQAATHVADDRWADIQEFVETYAGSFVDHTVNGGDFGGEAAVPLWTFSALATAAGITAGDWTRQFPLEVATLASETYDATGAPAIANGDKARCLVDAKVYARTAGAWVLATGKPDTYTTTGRVRRGDYLRKHVFNEIAACLALMRWTGLPGYGTDDGEGWSVEDITNSTCETARNNAIAAWAAESGSPTDVAYSIRRRWGDNSGYPEYYFWADAQHGFPSVDGIQQAGLSFDWKLYLLPFREGDTFADLESIGLTEGEMLEWETGSEVADTESIVSETQIGGASKPTFPILLAPARECPVSGDYEEGCGVNMWYVIQWHKTYT